MFRYAKAAAQKLTQTVIETAIKGGGGIVKTLKKYYSMNDLNNLGEEETKRVSSDDVNLDRKILLYQRKDLLTLCSRHSTERSQVYALPRIRLAPSSLFF